LALAITVVASLFRSDGISGITEIGSNEVQGVRVRALIQTPLRNLEWSVVGRADRGQEFSYASEMRTSPRGEQYYLIYLGNDTTKQALIWAKESELLGRE
jgi:hypothetical protein